MLKELNNGASIVKMFIIQVKELSIVEPHKKLILEAAKGLSGHAIILGCGDCLNIPLIKICKYS